MWDQTNPNRSYSKWGLLWRSENLLDGKCRHLISEEGKILFFHTRQEARDYAYLKYGYIKKRPDLQAEPHGWDFPKVVKIKLSVEVIS